VGYIYIHEEAKRERERERERVKEGGWCEVDVWEGNELAATSIGAHCPLMC
jgi:hypothetical protein